MWKKAEIASKLNSCDKLHLSHSTASYDGVRLVVKFYLFWIFAFAIDPFGTRCPMRTQYSTDYQLFRALVNLTPFTMLHIKSNYEWGTGNVSFDVINSNFI